MPQPSTAAKVAGSRTTMTQEQLHAFFDILTHCQTYSEIENFKYSDAVTNYGFPFSPVSNIPSSSKSLGSTPKATPKGTPRSGTTSNTPRSRTPVPPELDDKAERTTRNEEDGVQSTSPLMQTLLTKLLLHLPGIRDLPGDFWSIRVQGLLVRLGDAELSESYDKGALGLRKTLATLTSSMIEMIGRGVLGGVPRREAASNSQDGKKAEYAMDSAEDLEKSWHDAVQLLVYGNLVDEMFDHMAKTDDLEGHSSVVAASTKYSVIHIATLMHHIFVLSPEGPYLLKLIENVNNLIPYKMVKQTLRVGNAATMISGMVRLLLTKLSVASITNWVGLTANADDGMNLLQRIISLVLSWDANEFKKSAEKVEKASEGPSQEMLEAIRQYVNEERPKHDVVRSASKERHESIITAIFSSVETERLGPLSDAQHTQCLEYYSALLSVHDREAISGVLCRQTPDLLTQSIKDCVNAYDPMIRTIHSQVDLRDHLESTQQFVEQLIKVGKPKEDKDAKAPSVNDYVTLLMDNRPLMYRWIHALGSKCPDVWEQFRKWTKESVIKLRKDDPSGLRRDIDSRLNDLLGKVPTDSQKAVLTAIDSHAKYLSTVAEQSNVRLKAVVASSKTSTATVSGPGIYISRWQDLLDETLITPATPKGPAREGKDVKHMAGLGKTGPGAVGEDGKISVSKQDKEVRRPNVSVVVEHCLDGFGDVIRDIQRAL